ncbi:hypothetical protein ACPVPU_10225 [Sphingomonas sp. CJ99]
MSMRTFSALAVLAALTACQGAETPPDGTAIANVEAQQADGAVEDGRILCATPGSDAFLRQCTLDRTEDDEGVVLTARLPDGGFHRLRITQDGRGVVAADGAEAAKVAIVADGEIEVAIGGARYRLPATIGPVAR